jgi:hypothetical protein
VSGYGIVVSLENGGKNGPSSGLNIVDLLDVRSSEVRDRAVERS